jgi:S-(hydroxymethyl)glutathione dehydrogenase/alcohol dehydrogenase
MEIEAAVLREYGDTLSVESLTLSDPKENEVMVRIVASGVCRSDVSFMHGLWPAPLPMVLGHEGAGIIEKAGPGVDPRRVGDKVILTFSPPCGHCRFCQAGRGNLCEVAARCEEAGSLRDGTSRLASGRNRVYHLGSVSSFATYAVVPAEGAITVGDDVDLSLGCLIGCGLTTGVMSVIKRANVRPGDSVAVFGCGGVGLSAIEGARLVSAYPVIAVDPVRKKRELAERLGATHTIDPEEGEVVSQVRTIMARGVDFAFDALGDPEVQRQAFGVTARGGTMVLVGQAARGVDACFPDWELTQYEQTILGSNLGGAIPALDFPRLANLLTLGKIDLASLVTHRLTLHEINEAVRILQTGDAGRIVIEM